MKKKISIITPVYNEQKNISQYYFRLCQFAEKLKDQYDFEFIITDNCSEDDTLSLLREISYKDSRFKIYKLSRNFGYQKSIWTGYTKSTGDAAIELDCDLQDPPELIEQFLENWKKGYKIVYGIRRSRKESPWITGLRKLFYRFIKLISDIDIPKDAGDFMLIDRVIIDELKKIKNHNLYIRGTIFSFGFKKTGIFYDREKRQEGESKFPLLKMVALAMDGIVSRSILPLRLASLFGIAVSLLTFIFSIIYLCLKVMGYQLIPKGFTTIILFILFSLGLSAIFLGIIGEYIARIYLQVSNMPITLIEEEISYEKSTSKISESLNLLNSQKLQ